MYLECIKLSGSTPAVGPSVSNHAVAEPSPQKVLSVTVAPKRARKVHTAPHIPKLKPNAFFILNPPVRKKLPISRLVMSQLDIG